MPVFCRNLFFRGLKTLCRSPKSGSNSFRATLHFSVMWSGRLTTILANSRWCWHHHFYAKTISTLPYTSPLTVAFPSGNSKKLAVQFTCDFNILSQLLKFPKPRKFRSFLKLLRLDVYSESNHSLELACAYLWAWIVVYWRTFAWFSPRILRLSNI